MAVRNVQRDNIPAVALTSCPSALHGMALPSNVGLGRLLHMGSLLLLRKETMRCRSNGPPRLDAVYTSWKHKQICDRQDSGVDRVVRVAAGWQARQRVRGVWHKAGARPHQQNASVPRPQRSAQQRRQLPFTGQLQHLLPLTQKPAPFHTRVFAQA
jgi:hypothetical protein